MLTDVGEYFVGAYLQLRLDCDVIDYNVRPPGGGLAGLEELDVIGLNLKSNKAYLCEVTTHIRGLLGLNHNQHSQSSLSSTFSHRKSPRSVWLG